MEIYLFKTRSRQPAPLIEEDVLPGATNFALEQEEYAYFSLHLNRPVNVPWNPVPFTDTHDWVPVPPIFMDEDSPGVQSFPYTTRTPWLSRPFTDDDRLHVNLFFLEHHERWTLEDTNKVMSRPWTAFVAQDEHATPLIRWEDLWAFPIPGIPITMQVPLNAGAVLSDEVGSSLKNFSLDHHEPWILTLVNFTTVVPPHAPAFTSDEIGSSLRNFPLEEEFAPQTPTLPTQMVITWTARVESYEDTGSAIAGFGQEDATAVIQQTTFTPWTAVAFTDADEFQAPRQLDQEDAVSLSVIQTVWVSRTSQDEEVRFFPQLGIDQEEFFPPPTMMIPWVSRLFVEKDEVPIRPLVDGEDWLPPPPLPGVWNSLPSRDEEIRGFVPLEEEYQFAPAPLSVPWVSATFGYDDSALFLKPWVEDDGNYVPHVMTVPWRCRPFADLEEWVTPPVIPPMIEEEYFWTGRTMDCPWQSLVWMDEQGYIYAIPGNRLTFILPTVKRMVFTLPTTTRIVLTLPTVTRLEVD